jgi:hypothetical protein
MSHRNALAGSPPRRRHNSLPPIPSAHKQVEARILLAVETEGDQQIVQVGRVGHEGLSMNGGTGARHGQVLHSPLSGKHNSGSAIWIAECHG